MTKDFDKKDIILLILFIITFICLFFSVKNNIYSPYSDIGREFYIPSKMNEGKILYKDIFCIYAPFGYYINALITKIFGNSFCVFQTIGLVLSFVVLCFTFLTAKMFTGKKIAAFLTVLTAATCVFMPSVSNYITPYSYCLMYALTSVFASLYFFFLYTESNNQKCLYLSAFLFGYSLSCKYEYCAFIIPFLLCLFLKKEKRSNVFKTVFFMLAVPVITVLFTIKCAGVTAFIESLKYSYLLAKAPSVSYFYKFSGILPSADFVSYIINSLLHPGIYNMFYSFYALNVILLIISLILKNDKKLILLQVSTIFLCLKTSGGISCEIYGTFFLPFLFVSITSFFAVNLKEKGHKIIILILILLSLVRLHYDFDFSDGFKEINTSKGAYKVGSEYFRETVELINFIQSETNESDKILVLPEGVLINYLTERKSNNKLFYLIPPNIEILTEEKIINEITDNKPDYIIISNIMYPWYNQTSFYRSFGKNIYEFLNQEYTLKTTIGDNLTFCVYTLKR